ncbi:MAG TPA: MBL fold metallo-hydrolase [Ktedonobacterales bacterium]|nr:MBL fold metallo-hydrolase [Ktedonobacterales bacterium]
MGDVSVVEGFAVGELDANCYLIVCPRTQAAMVVDPGDEAERILARIHERGVTVAKILHTHGHFDHIGATEALLAGLGSPVEVLAHSADGYLYTREARRWGEQFGYPLPESLTLPDSTITDGMLVEVGTLSLRVIATPGHTPGSICLLHELGDVEDASGASANAEDAEDANEAHEGAWLLSGDTLFRRGIGRTDLPGGDEDAIYESILTRLYPLPADLLVFPGHGRATTIGEERRMNPFVRGD